MVQDLFQGSQRTKVMACIGMAMGLSPPFAAVIGGHMHVRFGWQSNFILVMVVALPYMTGNFLTSRLIHRKGERWVMALGQAVTLAGLLLMLGLALARLDSPLAFTVPLMLMGVGHGFLMRPALAGTVGIIPALAGSAAALAGLMQQLMGALGGYSAGLVSHQGSRNLGLLMLGFTLCALGAHVALRRQGVKRRI